PEKPGRSTADPSRALRRVAAAALDFLRCLSPEAAAEAARHLQSKADAARRWRDVRFAAAGGIFP
ncbi:MAG TPA: hypothetical protein GXX28_01740, partial [Firmicutes bacterium]|nr:hypothetical protein [Bacillota bacterium]